MMRTQLRFAAVATAALAMTFSSACAHQFVRPWLDAKTMKAPSQADYPESDAVYLHLYTQHFNQAGLNAPSFHRKSYHAAIAILNESGLRYSKIRIPYDEAEGAVVFQDARVIKPDGKVLEVKPENVYDDELAEWEEEANYLEGRAGKVQRTRVRVIALPHVEVGDILEYRVAAENPRFYLNRSELLWTNLPVQRREVEVRFGEWEHFRFKVYNTEIRPEWDEQWDQSYVRWSADNLPALPREGFRKHYSAFVPRYEWTLNYQFFLGIWFKLYPSWQVVVTREFKRLWPENLDTLSEDFELPEKAAAGDDKMARITNAYKWLQELAPAGFGLRSKKKEPRPFKEIVETGTATTTEQIILLRYLMDKEGIESIPAMIRSRDMGPLDVELPSPRAFDALAVFVPAQADVSEAMWIQPRCWSCNIGELHPDTAGTNAMLIRFKERLLKPDEADPEFVVTPIKVPARREHIEHIALKVEKDGTVNGTTTITRHGDSGSTIHDWDYSKKDRQEIAQRIPRRHSPSAVMTDWKIEFGSVNDPSRERSVTVNWKAPNLANLNGEQVVLPLSLLALPFQRAFEDPKRMTDIHFDGSRLFSKKLEIELPEGFVTEFGLDKKSLETDFAKMHYAAKVEGNKVIVTFDVKTVKGDYPVKRIAEFRDFFSQLGGIRAAAVTMGPKAPVVAMPEPEPEAATEGAEGESTEGAEGAEGASDAEAAAPAEGAANDGDEKEE